MKVSVNNKDVETNATTLAQLIEELSLPPQGIAVAVDNTLVPRTEWTARPMQEGLYVVIIKAACGG